MQKTVYLTYKGLEIEVSGQWTPYTPARITADPYHSHPAEGGTFDDARITVCGIDPDITELLDGCICAYDDIISLAENKAREE
jgi:hypothetical protein